MTKPESLYRRLGWCRLTCWIAIATTCAALLKNDAPNAWQVAAFGALFSVLWPTIRASGDRKASANSDAGAIADAGRFARLVDVSVDLMTLTALVCVTGGLTGSMTPLYILGGVETFVLLGRRTGSKVLGAAAIVGIANAWAGAIPPRHDLRIVIAIAAGLISGALVALTRESPLSGLFRRALTALPGRELAKPGMIDKLEGEITEMDGSLQHLKESYRGVARVSREQKTLIEHLRIVEDIYNASRLTPEGDPADGYIRVLTVVMRALDAGGAVLWLRDGVGDALIARCLTGRIAPIVQAEPILANAKLSPTALRAECEARLALASPAGALIQFEMETAPTSVRPVLALPFRAEPNDPAEVGRIVGAIGLCDPRGVSRFAHSDMERLQSLLPALSAAIENLREGLALQRRVQETSLLYELSRLIQGAEEPQNLYEAVVNIVERVVSCENCTLYLLDRGGSRLEQRASRGRPVNLLTHFSFDKGPGVTGWVAGKGRLLSIPDLKQEPNLLNVETMPMGVRSFAAVPLRANGAVIGVLNVSDSRPHAFSSDDVQLLSVLAGQAAITIERSETFRELESLAIVDGLTQVFNRRYFDHRLEEETRRARRYNSPLTVMIVDLDHFKSVNDRYGHLSGDLVLREFAALLRQSVRDTEIVGRFGGEEFAVILPETSAERASVAMERIRGNLSRHAFATSDGRPLKITISAGLADTSNGAESATDLVARADQALYEAKNSGRNCFRLAASNDIAVTATAPTPIRVAA